MPLIKPVTRALRALLSETTPGALAPTTVALDMLCSALGPLVTQRLREAFPDAWQTEGVDRVLSQETRRTGASELELTGLATLASDQTVTPIRVRLSYRDADRTLHLRASLGEPGVGAGVYEVSLDEAR